MIRSILKFTHTDPLNLLSFTDGWAISNWYKAVLKLLEWISALGCNSNNPFTKGQAVQQAFGAATLVLAYAFIGPKFVTSLLCTSRVFKRMPASTYGLVKCLAPPFAMLKPKSSRCSIHCSCKLQPCTTGPLIRNQFSNQ